MRISDTIHDAHDLMWQGWRARLSGKPYTRWATRRGSWQPRYTTPLGTLNSHAVCVCVCACSFSSCLQCISVLQNNESPSHLSSLLIMTFCGGGHGGVRAANAWNVYRTKGQRTHLAIQVNIIMNLVNLAGGIPLSYLIRCDTASIVRDIHSAWHFTAYKWPRHCSFLTWRMHEPTEMPTPSSASYRAKSWRCIWRKSWPCTTWRC